ncbi:hypothetical protein ACFL6K_00190 [Candidatus Latescibacterota bacterium]
MNGLSNEQIAKPKIPLLEKRTFMYFFMFSILLYILICGYILFFSSSVLIEGIANGWYKAGADTSDNYALWWSFLTSFPCLMSVLGGIAVLSSSPKKFHNVKILLFTPSLVWSIQLVIGNFRWGLLYWEEWLYLVPIMIFTAFMLFCVVKKVRIPILAVKPN